MVTVRRYFDPSQADFDRSLLEAAGIPSALADESSLLIGPPSIVGGIRLQVQEEDADQARRVLVEHEGFSPLPDDFVPPEEKPETEAGPTPLVRGVYRGACVAIVSLLVAFGFLIPIAHFIRDYRSERFLENWNRGNANYRKGDYDGAILDYTKAIQSNPNSDSAYYSRGIARFRKGDSDGAIADYSKAIKINPDHEDVYCSRGIARYKAGDDEAAIADYGKAIEINPSYAVAYDGRGLAKIRQGDYDGAIVDCTKAIEIKPKHAHPYNNRAWAEYMKGDYDGAIADATQATQLDPKADYAYGTRGWARYEKGDTAGAAEDCRKAIELLTADSSDGEVDEGLLCFINGDYQKAVACWEKAIQKGACAKSFLQPWIEKAKAAASTSDITPQSGGTPHHD